MDGEKERQETLHKLMEAYTCRDVAVAFSGGVDSALLLKLAVFYGKKQGSQVYAITASTELHPLGDEELAAKVAGEMGALHRVLRLKELEQAGIQDNPKDRCYRCKKYLFQKINEISSSLGADVVLEGTNADDLLVYRPGLKALKELGIKSPLMEAGLVKEQVRALAKEQGISVANRPSAPCLATRFPYGTCLTPEKLRQAEQGEEVLKAFGLYNVRLRIHGEIARIEVDPAYMEKILGHREEVIRRLKELGFLYLTLDLEGFRSGSMDVGMNAEIKE